jgi:YD repeat-containing protein
VSPKLSANYKFAAILLFLLPARCTVSRATLQYLNRHDTASAAKTSDGGHSPMSDREKAGLRGPVQQCTEQRTTPAVENFPARTYVSTTKYDRKGRLVQTTTAKSPDSGSQEYSITYIYDSTGRLLKTTSTNSGSPAVETTYSYDDEGRLIHITGDAALTSAFQYDDQGRKTRIVKSEAKSDPSAPAPATSFTSYPESDDLFFPVPIGGFVKTLFNDRDQATELQSYDAEGNLLSRVVRAYDAKGHIAETSYRLEGFEFNLPPEDRQKLMADPEAAKDFQKQITQLLGAKLEMSRESYIHDADGRLVEKHTHVGASMETITRIVYNDHSDKMEEHATTFGDPSHPKEESATENSSSASADDSTLQVSELRYSYQYDTFANCTEQTLTSPSSPDQVSAVRRSLKYF